MVKNYINGELLEPLSGEYFDNYDPSVAKAYGIVPDSDERDVDMAAQAANNAFKEWSQIPAEERSGYFFKIISLMQRDFNELARAECVDNGKPFSLAKSVDIPRAIRNLEFFASIIQGFESQSHHTKEALNYTLRSPLGVVGAISPWNLPLYLFTWKIAPALISGNCVIAKPSELTPMTAYLFSELCIEAGLPKGVLNVIHGYGSKAGRAIVNHPDVKAITFTGGTKTGREIASSASGTFKKLSLELGGKNPVIVFHDCDYEKMLATTLLSSFRNQGEICLCGSRIFVHKDIYEKFKKDFTENTKKLKVGDPLEPDTDQGAIVSKEHMEKILSYIELAEKDGGRILCGGKRFTPEGRCREGWFVEPTVIEGLPYDCKVNQEEIFGPVVTLIPFETEEEVLNMANSTDYGLASVIWTENLSRAHRVASQIQSGIVWVNCWMIRDLRTPFGGVKSSGIGREGGYEAIRFFTEAKNICIKI
ncbi:MAG: aldehyde dehydrogenase [Ignavibacteria bacterium]|nr:aldehyde dehydrogenase [Ignavibacteria bacterium]